MEKIKQNFNEALCAKAHNLSQTTIEESEVIIFFCFIVSRAGTDLQAALDQIKHLSDNQPFKPVILVVLHHTHDKDQFIPDSNYFVNNEQILTVDCVFYEDAGLLQCPRNDDAIDKIAQHLKSNKLTLYACFKEDQTSPQQSTGQAGEHRDPCPSQCGSTVTLIKSEEESLFQRCMKHKKLIALGCIIAVVTVLASIVLWNYLHSH